MTGPSDCGRGEDLSALLDGELAPERDAELRAHLAGCARCRAQLASLARVDVLLAGIPVRETSADLQARLRARIAAEDEAGALAGRGRGRRTGGPLQASRRVRALAAACAAAAAALALYFFAPRTPTPLPQGPETPVAQVPAPARDPDFDALPAEEIAVGLELDTAQDLDVIANLDLVEALAAQGKDAG